MRARTRSGTSSYRSTSSAPASLAAAAFSGVEGVGTVVARGDGVDDLTVGQRVGWLRGGQGSYAEFVAVDAAMAVPVPDGIPDDVATAVLMQGVTAHYLATDTYRVQPGDTVLVHAAAGGVGQLLTQVVRLRGGRVTYSDPPVFSRGISSGGVGPLAVP